MDHGEPTSGGYEQLIVWRKAMDLLVEAYALGRRLPSFERFGLQSQLQRAALSIPANIAEGNGRRHRKEYVNFLSIARGSVSELETHLHAFERLGYVNAADLRTARKLADEVSRMLLAIMRTLSRVPGTGNR